MEEFIDNHRDCIQGVLHGFDRMIFRGTLRSVSYADGLGRYMNSQGILLKNFSNWANRCTARLARHIEAMVQAAGRPCQYLASSGVGKEEVALGIASRDGIQEGLVCLLSCVEPCYSAEIYRNAQTQKLELRMVPRKCKFLYLYLIHPDFGWMHIRIQSWIPFDVQVYINGRSYLRQQLDKANIGYEQCDNCFRRLDDLAQAQAWMDGLSQMHWSTVLGGLLRPWWPGPEQGLLPEGPERYYWTIRQSELATDVMFRDADSLSAVYPRLCRHAIEGLSCQDILKFMGKSPSRFGGEVTSSYQRLAQGVRVKHTHGGNTIKMYDKGGSVLRIETTINSPGRLRVLRGPLDRPDVEVKWRQMSKSVADIRRRAQVSQAANERYLGALGVVGPALPAAAVLDPVTVPVVQGGYRYRGLRPVCPQDAILFAAAMNGEHLINGLTNAGLQALVFADPPKDRKEHRQRSSWVSRQLRLLRRHGLIRKLGARRLYRVTPKGQQVMGMALAIRQSCTVLSNVA